MPSNSVTLKRGTWFYFDHNRESKLGEIVNYAQDTERTDLYWFQCKIHYNLNENREIDEECVISSRDFEQYQSLELLSGEDGEQMLGRLRERDSRRQEGQEEQEGGETTEPYTAAATGIVAALGRVRSPRPTAVPETNTDEQDQEERDYISSQLFQPTHGGLNILTTNYKTPLGSGDMKSILKVYEVNPERSWTAVDTIINQTGHLLLTYTNADTRRKIIAQKVDYLVGHNWQELEINALYQLKHDSKVTKAIYLGGNHWIMNAHISNTIDGLEGKTFVLIGLDRIKDFEVERTISESREDRQHILENTQHVNPVDLTNLAAAENNKIYCLTNDTGNTISTKDISKNWEKAFTYNYYIGEDLDSRLDIKEFNDKKAIEKLAVARQDTRVLEALA